VKYSGCGGVAGVIFFTVGAVNSWMAMNIETCTQGSADSLIGGYITLIFYIAGAISLWGAPLPKMTYISLVPAALLAISHSLFAIKFAWGFLNYDMSACFAMNGGFELSEAGEWMDGREIQFILLWLALSAIFWIGLASIFSKKGSQKRDIATAREMIEEE
jgi:hypothetical protein